MKHDERVTSMAERLGIASLLFLGLTPAEQALGQRLRDSGLYLLSLAPLAANAVLVASFSTVGTSRPSKPP
jgi:hypothetical protein